MKVRLRISKDGASLYDGQYEVADADSFATACADAWMQLREKRLQKASSIGALFEALDDGVLEELSGADISIRKA